MGREGFLEEVTPSQVLRYEREVTREGRVFQIRGMHGRWRTQESTVTRGLGRCWASGGLETALHVGLLSQTESSGGSLLRGRSWVPWHRRRSSSSIQSTLPDTQWGGVVQTMDK